MKKGKTFAKRMVCKALGKANCEDDSERRELAIPFTQQESGLLFHLTQNQVGRIKLWSANTYNQGVRKIKLLKLFFLVKNCKN
jgi:hypothetical protein